MARFDTVQDVIDLLNKNNVQYLILRNYKNLLEDGIYEGGHEDIDFLVQDSKEVVQLLGAISNRKREDNTHYHIFVQNNRINLDLRHVGDGYYCQKWQDEMMERRVKYLCFYVMDDENYYYSLCYHAIIQKRKLTKEYLSRLNSMAEALSIPKGMYGDEEKLIKGLQSFMRKKGYLFTYTEDPSIPLRFRLVNKGLIEHNFNRYIRHLLFFLYISLYMLARNLKTKLLKYI